VGNAGIDTGVCSHSRTACHPTASAPRRSGARGGQRGDRRRDGKVGRGGGGTAGLSDIFSAASRFVRFHSAMASSASDGRASFGMTSILQGP
jgi:hypothetical protein